MTRATRQSWKNKPLERPMPIPYSDTFSENDYVRLCEGCVPEEMEDKWFVFCENDVLYLHDSWTGAASFTAKLEHVEDTWRVAEASKEATFMPNETAAYSASLLKFLIRSMLLKNDIPFPSPDVMRSAEAGLVQHILAGTAHAELGAPRRFWQRLLHWLLR